MNNAVETNLMPKPGPWVDKVSGLQLQLIAVQNNVCWYSNARSHNMFPMPLAAWLKSMRLA